MRRSSPTFLQQATHAGLLTDRSAFLASQGFSARTTPCFEVSADASAESTKVYVYDVIGGWYLDAAEFVQAVHAITTPTIDLHVNSPGGLVFDAVAMFEALNSHPATVNVSIDGLAASAASFLAMVGDTVKIAKGGRTMLHDAEGMVYGNAGVLTMYADILDSLSADISGYYADRAGRTAAEWRAVMQANGGIGTWYNASETVAAGLADSILGAAEDSPPEDPAPPADSAATHANDRMSQLIRARARVTLGKG